MYVCMHVCMYVCLLYIDRSIGFTLSQATVKLHRSGYLVQNEKKYIVMEGCLCGLAFLLFDASSLIEGVGGGLRGGETLFLFYFPWRGEGRGLGG